MAKETTKEKGQRLADEGRVEYVGKDERYEKNWVVRGESGSYTVKVRGIFLYCGCPSRKNNCSHVEAVNAVRSAEMRAQVEQMQAEEIDEDDPFADFFRDMAAIEAADEEAQAAAQEEAQDGTRATDEDEGGRLVRLGNLEPLAQVSLF